MTSALIAGAAVWAGSNLSQAIVLGASLSLSSTAIVLELSPIRSDSLPAPAVRVFPYCCAGSRGHSASALLSILAARSGGSALATLASALLQAAVAVTVIVLFGRVLLRPLFRLVAATQSSELFIAAALFVVVAAGVIADQAGLSMALGAFLAGLLLAETEYRKAIEATLAPFKGLLLGIFLLHRWDEHRFPRVRARAASAPCQRGRD